MLSTTSKTDVWDNIGLRLITLWVVELMHSEGLLTIFLRTGI